MCLVVVQKRQGTSFSRLRLSKMYLGGPGRLHVCICGCQKDISMVSRNKVVVVVFHGFAFPGILCDVKCKSTYSPIMATKPGGLLGRSASTAAVKP